ncbi:hypothetical protein ABW21_db0201719 [Orbilia brochopaga]|nr:hypothetical protein ABW21_db0201719 [Drechslerella brochopaga]
MKYGFGGQATAWRMLRLVCALPLLSSLSVRYGGAAQTVTSTITDTILEEDVVFSTTTETLEYCPCPCSGLATGSGTQTTTLFSLPSGSGIVVQIQFSLPESVTTNSAGAEETSAPELRTYYLNRNQQSIVADNSALVLYLNSAGVLEDASDLSDQVYFSLPSSIVKRQQIQKRFDDLLPVFIGDVPSDAVFQGFEDVDGNLFFVVTTSEGTFTLGFTICPTDNTADIGNQMYMFDTALGEPDISGCAAGIARTLAYSDYAAGSTTFPTGTETGGPTGTTTAGETTESTTEGTSSTKSTTTSGNTATNTQTTGGNTSTGTSRTSRTTSRRTTSNTTGGSSDTSSHTDTSSDTGSRTSTGSHTGITSTGTGGPTTSATLTTITAYTTDVASGSSSLVTNSPTVTEYLPYPSSLKVANTLRNFPDTLVNTTEYLNQFFKVPPGELLGESPQAIEYYRVFELDADGHLSAVIVGPAVVGDDWLGREDTEFYPQHFAFSVGADGAYTGDILKFDTLAGGEADGGRLLHFTIDDTTGAITLDDTVNVTLHAQLWLCDADATVIGLTDGNDAACNYDQITSLILWGNQVSVAGPVLYETDVGSGSTTLGLGEGPTYTVHSLALKVLVTATISIDPATASQNIFYGVTTVDADNTFPTGSVYVTQVVRRPYYSGAWNISGTVPTVSTFALTEGTATIATVQGPTVDPQFITGYINANYFGIPLFVSADDPPRLKTYGTNIDPTQSYPASYFWIDSELRFVVRRPTETGTWYPNPMYGYFQASTGFIVFYEDPELSNVLLQLVTLQVTAPNPDTTSAWTIAAYYLANPGAGQIDLSMYNGYTCSQSGAAAASVDTEQDLYFYLPTDPNIPFNIVNDCVYVLSLNSADTTHRDNFQVFYVPENPWRRDATHQPTSLPRPYFSPANHSIAKS